MMTFEQLFLKIDALLENEAPHATTEQTRDHHNTIQRVLYEHSVGEHSLETELVELLIGYALKLENYAQQKYLFAQNVINHALSNPKDANTCGELLLFLSILYNHYFEKPDHAAKGICLEISTLRYGMCWQYNHILSDQNPIDVQPNFDQLLQRLHIPQNDDKLQLMVDWMKITMSIVKPSVETLMDEEELIVERFRALITDEYLHLFEQGLTALFKGNHSDAFVLLVPRLEASIRDVYHKMTFDGVREARNGSHKLVSLETILGNEMSLGVENQNLSILLRYMLIESGDGLNLRNALWHGQWYPGPWSEKHAWSVFAGLCALHQLNEQRGTL